MWMCRLARARTEATGLLSGLLSCNGDRDSVFIYPSPQLSLLCLERARWTQCYWTLGELSSPLTLPTMQNVTAQNTPWTLILENKSWEGHSGNVQPLSESYLYISVHSEIRAAMNWTFYIKDFIFTLEVHYLAFLVTIWVILSFNFWQYAVFVFITHITSL